MTEHTYPLLEGTQDEEPAGNAGGTATGKNITWEIPAIVDPGEQGVSYEQTITDAILLNLKSGKARVVLHATPLMTTLRPPRYLHALKPRPKPKP